MLCPAPGAEKYKQAPDSRTGIAFDLRLQRHRLRPGSGRGRKRRYGGCNKGGQAGLKVILLETTNLMGGTSMGAVYLAGGSAKMQKELEMDCTQEDVTNWLLPRTGEAGDDLYDPAWCRRFFQKAAEVLKWLYASGIKINKMDASLSRAPISADFSTAVNAMAGMSALRDRPGSICVETFLAQLREIQGSFLLLERGANLCLHPFLL